MSTSNTRKSLRKPRRDRCKAHLSAYLVEHPGVVMPEVALRFLRFGHRPADLEQFMGAHAAHTAAIVVPEHIKQQGRAMFRQVQAMRARVKVIFQSIAEKKRQRKARRAHRRAA